MTFYFTFFIHQMDIKYLIQFFYNCKSIVPFTLCSLHHFQDDARTFSSALDEEDKLARRSQCFGVFPGAAGMFSTLSEHDAMWRLVVLTEHVPRQQVESSQLATNLCPPKSSSHQVFFFSSSPLLSLSVLQHYG